MGLMRWLVTGSAHKARSKVTTPGDRAREKSEWEGRYRANRLGSWSLFPESRQAYQDRTGDKQPSWWW